MPVESKSPASISAIRSALSRWYASHARVLPWRAPPGANARPDAYRVWLSEVMLQQTTVAAVTPYYQRFTSRWPTLADFAAADPADILSAWAGLGYYSRARNLIACARAVADAHGGIFPPEEAALRLLPGVGDYTAAAIAAIAFGQDAVPVDANVERVVARLFAIDEPLPAARKAIRQAAQTIWPVGDGTAGDFAQAMMDLGSSICTSRNPACMVCPLAADCGARAAGLAGVLPVKPQKKLRPVRHGDALWIERNGDVWLVRRPDKGMLGGMRALPGGDWTAPTDSAPPSDRIGTVRHIFTHFELRLTVRRGEPFADAVGEGEWWPISRLDEAGLPTLYRRAAEIAAPTIAAKIAVEKTT